MKKQFLLVLALVIIVLVSSYFFLANPPVGEPVIRIGVITDLSGFASVWGQNIQQGATLAAEEINQNGGINGQKLELIFEDGQSNNLSHVTAAQKLVSVDQVPVIIEQWTEETLSILPIAEENNTVIMCAVCSAPKFTEKSPLAFRTWGSDEFLIEKLVDYAKDQNFKRPLLVMTLGDWETGLKDAYFSAWGSSVPVESIERGSKDYRTIVTRINESNPDVIFLATNYNDALWLITQMNELGVNQELLAPSGSISQDIEKAVASKLVVADWEKSDQSFQDRFEKRWGNKPQVAADTAYDAVKLVAIAIEKNGSSTEQITKGLYEISNYAGASGEITIMPNRDRESREAILKIITGD